MDCLDYRILGNAKKLFDNNFEDVSARVINVACALLEAHILAHKEGLLALEEFTFSNTTIDNESDKNFFNKIMVHICDGYDPDDLETLCRTYLAISGPDTVDEYIRYVVMIGARYIQTGGFILSLEERLNACIPEKYFLLTKERFENKQKEIQERISKENKERFAASYPKKTSKDVLLKLEKIILSLSDNQVQRCLREIDNNELATIIKFCSVPAREKFFSNLSERLQDMIIDDVCMSFATESEMGQNAQKILNIINLLKKSDEI